MTRPPDTPSLSRERPLIWYDTLADEYLTGLVDLANMRVYEPFSDDEIERAVVMATSEPGRELAVSIHKSPGAAQQAALARRGSDKWPRVKIAVRTLPRRDGQMDPTRWAALVISV